MFQNVGEKLKVAAEVLFVIGVIALLLVVIFGTGQLLVGIIFFVPGALALWLVTALIYAFGDLVGDVQVIKDYRQYRTIRGIRLDGTTATSNFRKNLTTSFPSFVTKIHA